MGDSVDHEAARSADAFATVVIECDRVETRDLYWPPGAVESEVWKQVSAKGMSAPEAIRAEERWAELVPPDWVEDYTDWELVAE